MKSSRYCLLIFRPDIERIDVLCVGVVVLDGDGAWHISAPETNEKLQTFCAAPQHLTRMCVNLVEVLRNCVTLEQARARLVSLRSALALHEFEGMFSYITESDFNRQIQAILNESVLPATFPANDDTDKLFKVVRPHTRAKLRRQFENMGILAGKTEGIEAHKVVCNYPISVEHGLKAEFALKNSVMHITETIDFDVVEGSVRSKTFEAQAKCLALRAAHDTFGKETQRHIVVSGSNAPHAARTVDLLSTVGNLYATESAQDMDNYINIIAKAAGNPVMPSA